MAKKSKKRADHYEKPLHIDGTFDAVIGVALFKADEAAKEQKAQPKQEEKKPEGKK